MPVLNGLKNETKGRFPTFAIGLTCNALKMVQLCLAFGQRAGRSLDGGLFRDGLFGIDNLSVREVCCLMVDDGA